ncbi:hypothetical protein GB937_003583 [Aspergillus fischeri]|nr:hypothetical protein GB937_003583 [Aspergillus fischeri]
MKWGLQQTFGLLVQWQSKSLTQVLASIYHSAYQPSVRDGFHIFKPDVPADHDEYDLGILIKHHGCFGPFPELYEEIADQQ